MAVLADHQESERKHRESLNDTAARIFPPIQTVIAVGSTFLPVGGVGREDLFRIVLIAIFGVLAIQNLMWLNPVARTRIIISVWACSLAMLVHGFVALVILPNS